MKKLAMMFLCLSILATAVFAGPRKEKTGDVPKRKFVMGLNTSFPPMGFINDFNEIVGYDVDLAKEVCRRLDWELVLQPIDWDEKEQKLDAGEIDCIWSGFTITEERREVMLFSPPYVKNAYIIMVKHTSDFHSLADLAGKRVGVKNGSSSVDAIDNPPEFKALLEVVKYDELSAAFEALEAGAVDAVVADRVSANYTIGRAGMPFRRLGENLGNEEFGIAFRKSDVALEQEVWETLESMITDGVFAQISNIWYIEDISSIGK